MSKRFADFDNNLAYYEIPAQLACAYLKGHLKGRALDWFEVLGYRVIEDKATDYAHLKKALSEQFPVVRNSTVGNRSGEIFYFGGGLPQIFFMLTSSKDDRQSRDSTGSPVQSFGSSRVTN
ncbi:uncharacterized protein TNCV_1444961 [Trichonephila clavipes]|nr:uncharacterized protein TNCV_1444961 [Trichonephila clavipes]